LSTAFFDEEGDAVTSASLLALVALVLAMSGVEVHAQSTSRMNAAESETLCAMLQAKREFAPAIEHCNQAIASDPNNVELLSNRGSAYLSLGDFGRALDDFDSVISKQPAYAIGYFNRALVHSAQRRHEQAIEDYGKAVELMPDLAIAYNNRGHEFERVGERDKAIADYRKALAVAPSLKILERNLRRLGAEP
jgi:tetratricopeptide (TPR) repeat protein